MGIARVVLAKIGSSGVQRMYVCFARRSSKPIRGPTSLTMTFARIASRLRLLAHSERGMALPTALFAMIASVGLASAAVVASVDVQRGAKRDNGSKSAIAAADAGANVAMQRLNRYGDELSEEEPCLNVNAGGDLEAGDAPVSEPGWCAPVEGEVGDAAYSYRVSALDSNTCVGAICIVSTGSANEVNRRILLSLDESGLNLISDEQKKIEEKIFKLKEKEGSESELKQLEEKLKELEEEASSSGGIAGLVGREEITISGNANIRVGVATNGWLKTSGSITICGSIQTGVGKPWTEGTTQHQCDGYSNTQGTIELPSVSSFIPSDIATNNSNARLTKCNKGLPVDCQKDTYNGSWNGTIPFNPTTRAINLNGNNELTIGGGDYWICSLTLSGNQELIMADGAQARFFFDTPQNCGTSNQISISGNSRITSTGYQGKPGEFDMPGLYLLGSTTGTSQASISGNSSGNEFILYGPDTYVTISGNASKGIIVGRRVTISGNVKLEQDEGFEVPPELDPGSGSEEEIKTLLEEKLKQEEEISKLDEEIKLIEEGLVQVGSRSFHASSYVECSGGVAPAGAFPNAGC